MGIISYCRYTRYIWQTAKHDVIVTIPVHWSKSPYVWMCAIPQDKKWSILFSDLRWNYVCITTCYQEIEYKTNEQYWDKAWISRNSCSAFSSQIGLHVHILWGSLSPFCVMSGRSGGSLAFLSKEASMKEQPWATSVFYLDICKIHIN